MTFETIFISTLFFAHLTKPTKFLKSFGFYVIWNPFWCAFFSFSHPDSSLFLFFIHWCSKFFCRFANVSLSIISELLRMKKFQILWYFCCFLFTFCCCFARVIKRQKVLEQKLRISLKKSLFCNKVPLIMIWKHFVNKKGRCSQRGCRQTCRARAKAKMPAILWILFLADEVHCSVCANDDGLKKLEKLKSLKFTSVVKIGPQDVTN